MATIHADDQYSAALAEARGKYFGSFATDLPCACGDKITDHATQSDPNAPPRGVHDLVLGPTPSWREQLDSMKVYHGYWCESCGLSYRSDVIEDVRGYRPLEAREPIPRSHEVSAEQLKESIRQPQNDFGLGPSFAPLFKGNGARN